MKIKYNTRLVVLLGIFIGIFTLTVLIASYGQDVNASITETQYSGFTSISMNLFIEGVDGESIIAGRENSITALGYSHTISNPYDLMTGDLTIKQHSPLRVMKSVDKSSPKIFERCVKSTIIPSVVLRIYYEPDGLNFYTIELTNAKITSVQSFGTISVDEIPKETVSFTYETIKWTYTEYDEEGKAKGNIEAEDDWINPPG